MDYMLVLTISISIFWSTVDCEVDRDLVVNNHGYNFHQLGSLYNTHKDSAVLVEVTDSTKQVPLIVALQSGHPQQYQTDGHQAAQYNSYTYLPRVLSHKPANQYSVNEALESSSPVQYQRNPFTNLYIPFNQYQHVSTNINPNVYKPQLNRPVISKEQQTETNPAPLEKVPLFHHHVYHPLHTFVQHNQQNLQQKIAPPLLKFKQQLAPPTPPKIYRNFRPMIPTTHAPVVNNPVRTPANNPIKTPIRVPQKPETVDEEEKEEVNDEQEEENENIEDDDEENAEYNVEDDDEDPRKFIRGKFSADDDDDEDDHHHRGRYTHDDEDDDHDRHRSESRPEYSKLFTNCKHHKSYKKSKDFSAPSKTDPYFKNSKEFEEYKEPKVEFKMYKYSKSNKNPQRKEYIEGKESENIPVIKHNQKSYKEHWIISSKINSSSK